MDNKYVCISVLLHLKKHCLAVEKPQGLKMAVLGTSFGMAVCFSGFPWSLCREAKHSYHRLYTLITHMHAYYY